MSGLGRIPAFSYHHHRHHQQQQQHHRHHQQQQQHHRHRHRHVIVIVIVILIIIIITIIITQSAAQIAQWRQRSAKRGAGRGMTPIQRKATKHAMWYRLLPHHQIATKHAMWMLRFHLVGSWDWIHFWIKNFINPSHSSSFIIRCENPAKRTCNSACCTINYRAACVESPDSKEALQQSLSDPFIPNLLKKMIKMIKMIKVDSLACCHCAFAPQGRPCGQSSVWTAGLPW